MTRIDGADFSAIQGHVNWDQVAGSGIRFVYLKASEGPGYKDPKFDEYVKGAKDAGLYVGAYHFARPKADPVQQAEFFHECAKGLGAGIGELPPILDLEADQGIPGATVLEWARLCSEKGDELFGRSMGIYTSPYFWQQLGGAHALWAASRCLWVAQYTQDRPWTPQGLDKPLHVEPWPDWVFWQFSGDHGTPVPGVQVPCDRNLFNGTQEQLAALANIAPPTDPTPGGYGTMSLEGLLDDLDHG